MPYYDKLGNHKVAALVQGFPTYLFGGWGPSNPAGGGLIVAPTRFLITQVQAALTVATITGAVIEGNIPTVPAAGQPASLISVRQTQSNGGLFNVSGVAITAVSINPATGVGTISFTYTGTTFGPDNSALAAGIAVINVPETAEAIVAGASIPCTMPVQDPKTDSARTVSVVCGFPTLPTAVSVALQWAILDIDSEYENFGTTNVATVAGSAITVGPGQQFALNQARFYRLNISGLTGSGTITGKALV